MGGLIAAQWSLNETFDSLLGVVKAATSDGIPPGALVVAGSFGATLAVCDMTKLKVETIARSRSSYTIKFLKSKIGYAKGDSADHLTSSDGGVRFLSLACALLCTSNSFFAASTLHAMVLESAPSRLTNDQSMPTLKQLQQLLDALEYKLTRADFAKEVSGWQLDQHHHWPLVNDNMHPSGELIHAMVHAFRAIDRLGAGVTAEIRAYSGVPWIISFTKWCLGMPPSVATSDGIILEPGEYCKVHLYINKSRSIREEVRVLQKIESPDILWYGSQMADSAPWSGMVPVEIYGRQQLSSRGFSALKARKALGEALLFSSSVVMKTLWPEKNSEAGISFHPALGHDNFRWNCPAIDFSRFRSHIFGDERNVISILTKYLNFEDTDAIRLPRGGQLQQFPALEEFLQELIKGCGCSECSHVPTDYEEDGSLGLKIHTPGSFTDLASLAASITGKAAQVYKIDSHCALRRFWAQISIFTAEILALSLYNYNDPVRVSWPGEAKALARAQGTLTSSIYRCTFWPSRMHFCRTTDVLQLATSLLGHEVSEDLNSGTWIASASKGQVIYPLVFDLATPTPRPLLLGGGSGQIFFQNSKINKIVSRSRPSVGAPLVPRDTPLVVDRVLDLCPNNTLEWKVNLTAKDPELYFGRSHCQNTYNPYEVLLTMARSLFVHCEHSENTILPAPADDCVFTNAHFFDKAEDRRSFDTAEAMNNYVSYRNAQNDSGAKPFKIQVMPTDRNDGLRLFAMLSPFPGIVRDRACLQCCIDVCRKSGLEYIVL